MSVVSICAMQTQSIHQVSADGGGRRITASTLTEADVDPLSALLWHEAVYRHIGGLPEALSEVSTWLRHTLAGPRADDPPQRWLNYAMRLSSSGAYSGAYVGLLQATVHGGIAEVAYLLAPAYWGLGLAEEGLQWLHGELGRICPEARCWATTLPANERSWRLLERCGYVRVEPATAPALMSYDEGDWVFYRP